MRYLPPSVGPMFVRPGTSSLTQYPGQSGRPSSWGILRSASIIRPPTQIQQQTRSSRTPMSSIFRHVQRPPQTPLNSLPASDRNDILLQSPWVTRDLAPTVSQTKSSESTSKFSIIELIDIICQDGTPTPGTGKAAGPISNPSETSYRTKKSTAEEFDKNQAFALGTIKLPRKTKPAPMKQPGISSILTESLSQTQPRSVFASHGKPLDFLGCPSLIDDNFDNSPSFFSTPSTSDRSSGSSLSIFEFPNSKRPRSSGEDDDAQNTIDESAHDKRLNFNSFSTMPNQSIDKSLYFVTRSPISKRPRSIIVSPDRSRDSLNSTNDFPNHRNSVITNTSFISSMTNQPSSSSGFLSKSLDATRLSAMGFQDRPKDFLDLTDLNDGSGTSLNFICTSPALFDDKRSFNRREGSKRKVTFFDETESVSQPLF